MTMFLIELESCKSFWEVDFYHLRRRRRQQSTALLHNLVSFKRFDHNKMVKKALFVLLTSSFTKGEQACGTTADCNDGELCNFDDGESGGFCEPCPGETDQDCVDSGYITDLGTAECKSVCVIEQSEFFNDFFRLTPVWKFTFWTPFFLFWLKGITDSRISLALGQNTKSRHF